MIKTIFALCCIAILSGCSTMTLDDFNDTTPTLRLEEFFSGKTRAWGMFEDRFGTVQAQFIVDITGEWDGKTLTLTEDFTYNDGRTDQRIWTIEKTGENQYRGTAADIIGIASGEVRGNAFNWRYSMDLPIGDERTLRVKFNDWMFLQPDNRLLNRAYVTKWGMEVGQATIFFEKPEP